jgi:4a-hydroxytetrahydrobiopterin dehydratase
VKEKVELAAMKCKRCEGETPPMAEKKAQNMLKQVKGWELKENKIRKVYRFKNFKESMKFVNEIADLAQEEGHHPDIVCTYIMQSGGIIYDIVVFS